MIDLNTARDIFDSATDFTVGIEEEFAIVDPQTLELIPRFEQFEEAVRDDPILSQSLAGELISSEVEIRSGKGSDFDAALNRQKECRRRLFQLADQLGVTLGATGTHPTSDYRDQQIIDTAHYHRVSEDLQYVARRNTSFSLHIHVGVRGADRAVEVCDRLRSILPLLLAISANSPFVDGRLSGLHSTRSQIFTRMFPRCGIPDYFGSWDNWSNYVDLLDRTGSIVEFTQIWWSVRPHHSFGTVEVRICDAQMTASESEGLGRLIYGCVRQAAKEIDAGETVVNIAHRLIEENMWRAIRYGKDGRLLDLSSPSIEEFSTDEVIDRLCAWTGESISLPENNGAQRQRHMMEDGAEIGEVYKETLRQTRNTYYGL